MMEEIPLKIKILEINPHIVCSLCAGYFIDATTIMECLHTFCKTCIVKYLQSSKTCPQCTLKIHETQPLMNLKPDRVMQDIVYKLVPDLFENEEKRKQEFYKSRGLTKQKKQDENAGASLSSVYDNPHGHYYRYDELVCVCLEKYSNEAVGSFVVPSLPKKFVRCSVRTRVEHVQMLLRRKLPIPQNMQIDVICGKTVLPPEHCLKQVWLMHWIGKPSPLMLFYRIFMEEESSMEVS